MSADNVGQCRYFHSYKARAHRSYNCTIVEAALATCAFPGILGPIYIGEPGGEEKFVDAGLGCNNPVRNVLQEATQELKGDIVCLISVGSGKEPVIAHTPTEKGFKNSAEVNALLSRIASDCEAGHEEMLNQFPHGDIYFRFNVERGLEYTMEEEWLHKGTVHTHTSAYLSKGDVNHSLNKAIESLLKERSEETHEDPGKSNQMIHSFADSH